jgi:hypothetical protein
MIIQLNPPVPMNTPKGFGYANFLIDRGMEFDNEWIVFQDNCEIWSWKNSEVRLGKNITFGRQENNCSQVYKVSDALRNVE